jgi:tRNA A37 threonylcarbamoyladenosine biosynthesis protein TsaE
LGFDDLLAEPAATLCEWAEKAGKALPPDRLDITLEVAGPRVRKVSISATGERGKRLLVALELP